MNGFEEMAHVGNSMRDDIVGGNKAGVTTYLIRRRGISLEHGKMIKGFGRPILSNKGRADTFTKF